MRFLKKLFGARKPAPIMPIHPDDKELVTKHDVKWWKSLSLDDCKNFEKLDSITQTALPMKLVEEDGLSDEEAARRVRKSNVFYYETLEQRNDEPLGFVGDDAKLPYILKDRVDKAVINQIREMDKNDIASASSMNSIVRDLIRTTKV